MNVASSTKVSHTIIIIIHFHHKYGCCQASASHINMATQTFPINAITDP